MIIFLHLGAVTLAYFFDRLLGDPRIPWHLVSIMGKIVSIFDNVFNKGKHIKQKGLLVVILGTVFFLGISLSTTLVLYRLHIAAGFVFETCLIWFSIGGKSMIQSVNRIHLCLKNNDIENARKQTAMIVSRNTTHMNDQEITRSVLESTGENISDSMAAPMFYALLGGAPLAVWYRFVNTADAMVGYKTEKYIDFGWAAARLDDVLNYIPARLTAFLMIFTAWKIKKATWQEAFLIMKKYSSFHDSPNSGYGEAAMAAVLNVTLGGPTSYHGKTVSRPYLGNGKRVLNHQCINDGIIIWNWSGVMVLVFLWMIGGIYFVLA
ncbi:adenosylcobinamide-phosphate synthase [Salibacterium salarium]|uniref:adenosylcobinamide-phosphate synthase CbiB n=1 Tax=Salibacterium salarium TaxID=284579 RepID=UPI0027815C00|nr:adenosylcobinamide-phosphate synthase CbiB [Salibacterium salarium]MDQ0299490.1 adenosylcobinamide-phosphate synthase [Salibacterium salarium]